MTRYFPTSNGFYAPSGEVLVLDTLCRVHLAIRQMLSPVNRRPTRRMQALLHEILEALQPLYVYLQGATYLDVSDSIAEIDQCLAALADEARRRERSFLGQVRAWIYWRRHTEQFKTITIGMGSASGKRRGEAIPNALRWLEIEAYDRKIEGPSQTRH